MRESPRLVHAYSILAAALGKFKAQPALAHAGVAGDANNSTASRACATKLPVESLEYPFPPDQRAQPRPAAKQLARRRVANAGQLEDLYRGGETSNRLRSERSRLNELLGRGKCIGGEQNAAALCHLLQPAREMHVHAGGIDRLIQRIGQCLDDDIAGVQTDANFQIRITEPRKRILHL